MANEFEKFIEETFSDYRNARLAHMYRIHPPMRIAGMMGKVPCFVQSGKAPYDVAGFHYDRHATSIGAELKGTRDRKPSLKMFGPDEKGGGLQYHQLAGLVRLHEEGGTAVLLWNNGGEIGRMDGPQLVEAKARLEVALKSKNPPKGAKSIPWADFKSVRNGVKGKPLWLPKPPDPCKTT